MSLDINDCEIKDETEPEFEEDDEKPQQSDDQDELVRGFGAARP